LDTGVDETIQLVSRDEQTSILVSYKELKATIASAFNDVYTNNNNTTQKQ
jgi:PAB-dependent poly(A)-specific ribonuclease subunit 3